MIAVPGSSSLRVVTYVPYLSGSQNIVSNVYDLAHCAVGFSYSGPGSDLFGSYLKLLGVVPRFSLAH